MKQLTVLKRDDDLIVWSEGEIIDRAGRSSRKSFSKRLGNNASAKKSGDLWQEPLCSKLHHSFDSNLQKAESKGRQI